MSTFEGIPVTLDKERHLKLTLYGARKLKQAVGIDLLKGFSLADLGVEEMAAFLWACLVWEDDTLTIDSVSKMVDAGEMVAIQTQIAQAVNQSLPEKTDSPNAESRSTG